MSNTTLYFAVGVILNLKISLYLVTNTWVSNVWTVNDNNSWPLVPYLGSDIQYVNVSKMLDVTYQDNVTVG